MKARSSITAGVLVVFVGLAGACAPAKAPAAPVVTAAPAATTPSAAPSTHTPPPVSKKPAVKKPIAKKPAPKPTTKRATPRPRPPTAESTYYANCTDLRKDYPDGVSSKHPAYRSGLDRDKDNWACETSG